MPKSKAKKAKYSKKLIAAATQMAKDACETITENVFQKSFDAPPQKIILSEDAQIEVKNSDGVVTTIVGVLSMTAGNNDAPKLPPITKPDYTVTATQKCEAFGKALKNFGNAVSDAHDAMIGAMAFMKLGAIGIPADVDNPLPTHMAPAVQYPRRITMEAVHHPPGAFKPYLSVLGLTPTKTITRQFASYKLISTGIRSYGLTVPVGSIVDGRIMKWQAGALHAGHFAAVILGEKSDLKAVHDIRKGVIPVSLLYARTLLTMCANLDARIVRCLSTESGHLSWTLFVPHLQPHELMCWHDASAYDYLGSEGQYQAATNWSLPHPGFYFVLESNTTKQQMLYGFSDDESKTFWNIHEFISNIPDLTPAPAKV